MINVYIKELFYIMFIYDNMNWRIFWLKCFTEMAKMFNHIKAIQKHTKKDSIKE